MPSTLWLLVSLLAGPASTAEPPLVLPGEELVYGENYAEPWAFCLQVPAGWRIEDSLDLPRGIQFVLCPEVKDCNKSKTFIQLSGVPRVFKAPNVAFVMNNDISGFLKDNPGMESELAKPLTLPGREAAPVVHFFPRKDANPPPRAGHHAVVFLELDGVYAGLSLITDSREHFDAAEPILREVAATVRRIRYENEGKEPYSPGTPPRALLRQAIQDRCLNGCSMRFAPEFTDGSESTKKSSATCKERCLDDQALDNATDAKPAAGAGTTKEKALEACFPLGGHDLLKDLRCQDGEAPKVEREGLVGHRNPVKADQKHDTKKFLESDITPLEPGELDTHIVDKWKVTCGNSTRIVFIDRYHCTGPLHWTAPEGFARAIRKAPMHKLNLPPEMMKK